MLKQQLDFQNKTLDFPHSINLFTIYHNQNKCYNFETSLEKKYNCYNFKTEVRKSKQMIIFLCFQLYFRRNR